MNIEIKEEDKKICDIGGLELQEEELKSHMRTLKPSDEQLKLSRKQIEEGFVSPVYFIQRIPIEKIQANSYNPNQVFGPEMMLLYDSVLQDGYTMPVVVWKIPNEDKYELIDGYHRYSLLKIFPDLYEREKGCLPCTVLEKDLADRMASTIRHNRARGTHSVDMMSKIVGELHSLGRTDHWIQTHLGMSKEEVLRLKQLSGLASLFENAEYSDSWELEDSEYADIFEDNTIEEKENE